MEQREQNELTNEQRRENLAKFDTLADSVSGTATTLGGLNTVGLYAGTIKAVSLFNAIIYTLPILTFGAALVCALFVKYYQWDMTMRTYSSLFAKKQALYSSSLILMLVGICLLFIALLVYTARTVTSLF